ncbi:MAG: hypothetical protein EKK42_28300 [Pseudonocardiaceae bacterium]|nr:MAG: hypothetical protein EKK42_28300 [Pseudonocardiaceae bacterium]
MPAAAWATIVIAALIIAVAGIGLLRVILHLRHVSQTLAALDGGVGAIVASTAPVPTRLTSVNANLKPVRDFCAGV